MQWSTMGRSPPRSEWSPRKILALLTFKAMASSRGPGLERLGPRKEGRKFPVEFEVEVLLARMQVTTHKPSGR